MAIKLNECPKCRSFNVRVVKVHNPDTQDMNAKATLACDDCGNEFEGRITSDHHKRQRAMGHCI